MVGLLKFFLLVILDRYKKMLSSTFPYFRKFVESEQLERITEQYACEKFVYRIRTNKIGNEYSRTKKSFDLRGLFDEFIVKILTMNE